MDIENLKNRTFTAERSGDLKNICHDISKLKPNKTDNNKPEYNNTDNNEPESLNKAEKENFAKLNRPYSNLKQGYSVIEWYKQPASTD